MTESRAIARNASVLAAARIVERSSGLVLALMISRKLGVTALGVYATATAYYSLIAIAASAGSTPLLIREIAKRPRLTSDYVVHGSVVAGALSALIASAAWVIVPHLGYSHDLTISLLLIVLATVPATLNTIQEAAFVAHQRVELETIMTFFSSVLLIGASTCLLYTGHGVVSIMAVFVGLEYAVTVCYFVLINQFVVRLHARFRRRFAVRLVRDIRAFAAMSMLAALFARPEVIMLSLVSTEANVGLYVAAVKIVDLWAFVPEVYMTNVFPILSRSFAARDGRTQELQDRSIMHLCALAIPVTVGICAASSPIITFFYGPAFADSATLLRILSITVTAVAIWAVLWRVLAAAGRQASVLRAQVVTIFIRIAVGAVLIVALSSVGAAISASASLALFAALLAVEISRSGLAVRILSLVWKHSLAAAAMGLVVAPAVAATVPLWTIVPAAAVVYAAGLMVLGVFSLRDLPSLRPHHRAGQVEQ
jgi:O-antigen/teichoic acid export membrane protein